jgi:hypothetical protein
MLTLTKSFALQVSKFNVLDNVIARLDVADYQKAGRACCTQQGERLHRASRCGLTDILYGPIRPAGLRSDFLQPPRFHH